MCLGPTPPCRLDWHKQGNQRLRCLRITTKEEKAVSRGSCKDASLVLPRMLANCPLTGRRLPAP